LVTAVTTASASGGTNFYQAAFIGGF
jgi:hypothetical protein